MLHFLFAPSGGGRRFETRNVGLARTMCGAAGTPVARRRTPTTNVLAAREGVVHSRGSEQDVARGAEKPQFSQVVVVGGGAAGFFAAIECARRHDVEVTVLEALPEPLTKVRISGGGRCNVTHAARFDDKELLASTYPRGSREMMSPFVRFGAQDTIEWFSRMGVELKTEPDGRMFPVSDSSDSIIAALRAAADRARVRVICGAKVVRVERLSSISDRDVRGRFCIAVQRSGHGSPSRSNFSCNAVLLSPGASRAAYEWAKELGHSVSAPVPSLFTLRVADKRLEELAGVSVPDAMVELLEPVHPMENSPVDTAEACARASKKKPKVRRPSSQGLKQRRELLITHWGFSGPAVLRLSAFGARKLFDAAYLATLIVNWRPSATEEQTLAELLHAKARLGAKQIGTFCPLSIPSRPHGGDADATLFPRRLWRALVAHAFESALVAASSANNAIDLLAMKWSDVRDVVLRKLARELHRSEFEVSGKGIFKEEFVTCGGVRLADVDLRTMQSKRVPGMYIAGEQLDVDAVTGGFNLQAAWTTGFIAGSSMRDDVLRGLSDQQTNHYT